MAKQGESEFDDFEMPSDEASPESLPDLSEPESLPDFGEPDALPDLSESESLADLSELGELEEATAESLAAEPASAEAEVPEVQPTEEKEGERRAGVRNRLLDRLPANRGLAIAIAAPVLLVLLWLVGLIYFSSIVYLVAVASVPYGLWRYRDTSTIYTVLLGCAVVAILTAILFLWREWGTYGFDRKAKALRPTASVERRIDGATVAEIDVTMRLA